MADFAKARRTMVDRQVRTADVTAPRVLAAMAEVPRELFVPRAKRSLAYSDADIEIAAPSAGGAARYLIEPAILARLVQLAAIGEGDIVLDIGCGTGYGAAVLARLAGAVVALEPDADLAAAATETLIDLGVDNAAVVTAAVDEGYPSAGPYDVILLEGSVESVPPALFDQLKAGGRLVAVIGPGPAGMATLYRKNGDVAGRPAFNAPIPPLPCPPPAPTFVF
ncbi:MAG: protein-L-isoaspartate O-methyltransferase [Bauldia sp.]|nr:protein-L-isoaspartate O-methyltransferase [Bauldia sp.]